MDEGSLIEPHGESADPVRWARTRELFRAALELDPALRAPFIEAECGDDDVLRSELTSLLASDVEARDFMEQPAAAMLARNTRQSFAPRLVPGTKLGRYEILEFLGAGGISQVYRAQDTHLGRTVALKLVTDPEDREAGARLLAEAQHASILNHPNICGVHEAESDHELPFLVLELIEGPALSKVLKERRASIGEVVQWGKAIAIALDHAHRCGVIHRDLKSSNVALSRDGTVKVLDFGLSRRIAPTTGASASAATILADASIAGTLTHIAPETLRGEPLDHRVDLWALGVMLYEMATGRLPFSGASAFETSEAILHEPPPRLPQSVPLDLQRVILRCLAKDPAARFSTASELFDALLECEAMSGHRATRRRGVVAAAVGVTAVLGVWYGAGLVRSPDPVAPVVAILPFENQTGDATEQFFADGMTEALIGELGRIDGVRVIAPGASMQRRRSTATIRDAALKAGANRLLHGSVVRDASGVRLNTQLMDAASSVVIWSEVYQRTAREVMALQAEVAQAVARAVKVELSSEDARRFSAVRAVDPDVYEAYLKGRYYWNQRTADSLRTAVTYFQTAITLDPSYAPAYASLADSYNLLGTVMVAGGSPREWRPKATDAAVKALQIDADLGEAHATLGYLRHYEWQWEEAENSFRRAIALNPNNALARIWYSNLLCSLRRFDDAVHEGLIARDLDPLSLIVSANVGWVYFRARRFPEAIAEYQRGVSLDPTYVQGHMRLADAYLAVGRFDDAISESETVVRLSNRNLADVMTLERMKLLARRPNEFNRRLDELITLSAKGYTSPATVANAYFATGRNKEGFVWLQRAFDERTNNMAYLAVEPVYDAVRDDPRFQALLRAIGLP